MSWFSDAFESVADVVSSVADTAGDAVGSVVDAAGDVVGEVVTPETAAIAAAIALAQPELAGFAATAEGSVALGSGLAEGWGLAEGAAAASGAATVWSVADTLKATTLALKFYRNKEHQDELDRKQREYEDRRMQILNRSYNAPALLGQPSAPANPSPYELSLQNNPRASTLPFGYQPPPTDDLGPKWLASPAVKTIAAIAGLLLLISFVSKGKPA